MTNNYSAGEYIEAWCTKCKLELGHTIIAMIENVPKRVQCNTCNGKHNYRMKPSERRKTTAKKATRKIRSRELVYEEYLAKITGGDFSHSKKYSIKGNFEKDDILDHTSFGMGIVLRAINSNKIEVLFKKGQKLLTQNREL
jgi:hypothetical protein